MMSRTSGEIKNWIEDYESELEALRAVRTGIQRDVEQYPWWTRLVKEVEKEIEMVKESLDAIKAQEFEPVQRGY